MRLSEETRALGPTVLSRTRSGSEGPPGLAAAADETNNGPEHEVSALLPACSTSSETCPPFTISCSEAGTMWSYPQGTGQTHSDFGQPVLKVSTTSLPGNVDQYRGDFPWWQETNANPEPLGTPWPSPERGNLSGTFPTTDDTTPSATRMDEGPPPLVPISGHDLHVPPSHDNGHFFSHEASVPQWPPASLPAWGTTGVQENWVVEQGHGPEGQIQLPVNDFGHSTYLENGGPKSLSAILDPFIPPRLTAEKLRRFNRIQRPTHSSVMSGALEGVDPALFTRSPSDQHHVYSHLEDVVLAAQGGNQVTPFSLGVTTSEAMKVATTIQAATEAAHIYKVINVDLHKKIDLKNL